MTKQTLTARQLKARWRDADILLSSMDFDPLAELEVDAILRRLPKRLPDEPLEAWLLRGRSKFKNTGAVVIPFPNPRFVPITEFVRRAACSEVDLYPLPDSGPLESVDGRFRLTVNKCDQWLMIAIEALGLAADDFANCYVGLSSGEALENVAVTIYLNADGDGECKILDSEIIRKVLLNPLIGAIRGA